VSLTDAQIEATFADVKSASASGDKEAAWAYVQPMLRIQDADRSVADALLKIVRDRLLKPDHGMQVYEAVEAAYAEEDDVIIAIGEYFAKAVDIDFLNAQPPATALAPRLIEKLQKLAHQRRGHPSELTALDALAGAGRVSGRRHDAICERAYRRLLEIDPNSSRHRYNFGLFLKTRGRFAEGMAENKIARELRGETDESTEWNFGICATGAEEGEAALEVWKRMGHNIELGQFGLPEGRFPECKVRLAERPLAERGAENDDPGIEETIWIERLSACHGIIRSVLYDDLGVDYGDVILFDGAPITYHKYGEEEVPVFPHLVTLFRRNYQFFEFAGTQMEGRQIQGLSRFLDSDSVIYSHTESFQVVCMECWKNPNPDHHHGEEKGFNVVRGRIAASPEVKAADLLSQIDGAISQIVGCRLFSPELCIAAGNREQAKFEERRFNELA
jgi:hypothetical protein